MLLYVDIIDACHLKCPTCPRGVRAFPNTSKKMSLGMFREIVAKAKEDGAYRVDLFSWMEPFLCPNLHEYIEVVKNAGLPCGVSSTLSLRRIRNFEAALALTDVLTISISGFSQEIYQINHVGGRVEWVKQNLKTLAELKRNGGTAVGATLRMLMFDYNRGEEAQLRELADATGIAFEVLLAEGHPVRLQQPKDAEARLRDRVQNFSATPRVDLKGKVCPLIFEHVTINADGDVYQCSAYGNYDITRIGPFLELSREEVLLRRYTHPMCNSCGWTRRDADPIDRALLEQALLSRLGFESRPRLSRLSWPRHGTARTSEGYIVSKSRQFKTSAPPDAPAAAAGPGGVIKEPAS